VFIVATGLGAGVWAFSWAFDEAIELQDAILLQVGVLAAENNIDTRLPPQDGVDAEATIVIQEMGTRPVSIESDNARLQISTDLQDGLHTLPEADGWWRILIRTRPDGTRVAIGQPTSARDEIARDAALRAVLPLCVLIPCLMLVVAGVIHYSFRPVTELARRLDAKQRGHLHPLPLEGLPDELHPFVGSINRLLDRLALIFEQQRRFIAHAAHELRTPITALSIQAQNLESSELIEESRSRLIALRSGIRRVSHLLEQLLALAKYDLIRPTLGAPIALDGVVKSVVADLLPTARARAIDVGFSRLEGTSIRADAMAIAVMVRNLVDNAIRYSPDGGQVDVSVFQDGHRGLLRIENTGPGIPVGDLDAVFEPFNRGVRTDGEGTGLGLSIVQLIARNHQGSVILENVTAVGRKGLRATVALPAG
jgi:two-component system, OmpR family, sensor kinase